MLQHHVIGRGGFEYLDARAPPGLGAATSKPTRGWPRRSPRLAAAPRAFLIQDYHLYPLPALLRASFPDTPILHFTHIPFPDPPVLRLLPAGVARDDPARACSAPTWSACRRRWTCSSFLGCCAEFLDATSVDAARRRCDGRRPRRCCVRAYPGQRRPARAAAASCARPRSRPRTSGWHRELGELTIIRVDRLDPSKNQLVGFLAFARLLEMRPDLRGRVRFLAFLVPSRTDLGVYRAYRDAVYRDHRGDQRPLRRGVRRRRRFSVFYTNDRDQALAAMERCDVLLVNSLAGRDEPGRQGVGRGLAADPGVLIVSETAGVAAEAADSALLISPLDVEGTAQAMADALDMPRDGRAHARLARSRERVTRWTARDWLAAQLEDLGLDSGAVPRALRGTALRG